MNSLLLTSRWSLCLNVYVAVINYKGMFVSAPRQECVFFDLHVVLGCVYAYLPVVNLCAYIYLYVYIYTHTTPSLCIIAGLHVNASCVPFLFSLPVYSIHFICDLIAFA